MNIKNADAEQKNKEILKARRTMSDTNFRMKYGIDRDAMIYSDNGIIYTMGNLCNYATPVYAL